MSSAQTSGLVVENATCVACGCLCDDLALRVDGGRVVEARHACERGAAWFTAEHQSPGIVEATVDGKPAGREEAVVRAVEILKGAKAPVVLGLTRTATETTAAALAIADRIGAVVELASAEESSPITLAVQRIGRVSATLGEVKNRADVLVFWGGDPVVTHPRHWERYSAEARGRFVPEGRAGRHVIVVDAERTATADRADQFLQVAPERQFEMLWTLRALVRGVVLEASRVEAATGLSLSMLGALADRLKAARYGALFFGAGLGRARGGASNVEAALLLVRDLNEHTRFVALTLGQPGNASGADAALTWQTGFSGSVDLARGYPRSVPGVTSAVVLLARGEADAALVVGEQSDLSLPEAAAAHLARIPRVVISPGATAPGESSAVALASATPAIDASGTVMRPDGVVLPLRPPLAPRVPTDRVWLEAIETRLNEQTSS